MTVSSQVARVSYAGNGSTKTFAVPFYFLADGHLKVVLGKPDNTETVYALTTNYTVADAGNPAGGSITLTSGTAAPASGESLVIVRNVPLTQETDYQANDDFPAESHERALDKVTMEVQQLAEEVDRSAKLPVTSSADAEALVADIVRLADSADNIDTVATNVADVNTVASGIGDVIVVSTNIDDVTVVSTNIANVNTVADDLNEPVSEINTVAVNITNVNTVGGNIASVNTVAGISSNVTTVAGIAANVTTVAGKAAEVTTVAGIAWDVTTVAGIASDVSAVENISANVTTVAGISANVTTVAGISGNVTTVAGNNTNVTTVATNIASVNSAATNMAAIIAAPSEASAAAASAAAAAASAASGTYSAVQDKSADYTVVVGDAGDLIRMTTSGGACTVTLPAISTVPDGFNVTVVKWTGDTNNVTVTRSGSDTINGSASYVLDAQYKSATFVSDSATSTWFASGSGSSSTNIIVDAFNGTGAQTAFTLSGDPGTENNTQVFVGGVYQEKDTYSVSGSTLTFSAAPPAGTSNIEVVWSQPLAIGTPADGSVGTVKLADSAVTTEKIADANVTYAKMQSVTAGKVLGRRSSGNGVVQELPISVDDTGKVTVADLNFTGSFYKNGVLASTLFSHDYNWLHNGRFNVWQRYGTTINLGGGNQYPMDRWRTLVSGTVQFLMAGQGSGNTYLAWQASSANSFAQPKQFLEANDVFALRAQVVTFSFYYSGSPEFVGAIVPEVSYNASTDASSAAGWTGVSGVTTTTSSTPYGTLVAATFTVPANAIGLVVGIIPTNTQPNTAAVGITNARLTLGTVPPDFGAGARTFDQELHICKRFFEKSYAYSVPVGSASQQFTARQFVAINGSDFYTLGHVDFEVEKYATPSIVLYNPATGAGSQMYSVQDGASTGAAAEWVSTTAIGHIACPENNMTGSRIYGVHYRAESEV